MPQFQFAIDAVETLQGRAYFTVEAETEEEARKLLDEDASEYFDEFDETTGGVEWDAKTPDAFELL